MYVEQVKQTSKFCVEHYNDLKQCFVAALFGNNLLPQVNKTYKRTECAYYIIHTHVIYIL